MKTQITPREARLAIEIIRANVGPNTVFVLEHFVEESIAARFGEPKRESPCEAPRVSCHLTFSWYCSPCRERRNRCVGEGRNGYPSSDVRPPAAAWGATS